jgi:predicted dehydrogenase
MRIRYYASNEDRSWWKPFLARIEAFERIDPLAAQMKHFAAVIHGDAEPLVTARDGLQNLRVTDAIAEAARTGRIVNTMGST